MVTPLLTTKLYIPPTRPEFVLRPRLIKRLNESLQRKLTLISAPAGFGKTTLLSEWATNVRLPIVDSGQKTILDKQIQNPKSEIQNRQVVWLALDEGDNDPNRFLAYFATALQTIEPQQESVLRHAPGDNIGAGELGLLQSPQPPSSEVILTTLINEIAEISGHIILVLDDYHVIEAQSVDQALTFLLDHLPPQMHLIIASRTDPSLPLSRLRARGQMTEIRIDDLRFTSDEVAAFLETAIDLPLSPENVAALETRTEGWIAGLQLAALSIHGLQGCDAEHITSFITSFSGSNRYIIDYLADEVLQQRPEGTEDFLLQTSILSRLSAPLCEAVCFGDHETASRSPGSALTKQRDSQAILEALEVANLFIIPLDAERRWYRYHHLFADLLRQRLRREQPERIPVLHRRASEWYEDQARSSGQSLGENGLLEEAIKHALAAKDFKRAARLIEELAEVLWRRGEPTTLLGWLKALPAEQIDARPQLCTFHAWTLYMNGQNQAAELRLQGAERALGVAAAGLIEGWPEAPDPLPDLDQLEQLGRVAAIRASIAVRQGDVAGIFQFAGEALEYLSEQSLMWRSITAIALGFAQDLSGDTIAASRTYSEAVTTSQASGNIYLILSSSLHLGTILMLQGRLRQVHDICRELLQLAAERGVLHTQMAGCLYDELGLVLCEWNDLDEAMRHLKQGSELSQRGYDVGVLGWSCLTMLRALFTQGDMAGAEAIIRKMDKLEQESDVPPWYTGPKEVWKARLWLRQGKLDAASRWIQDRGLQVDGALPYLREAEYIALARILVAQNQLEAALELLERLRRETEKGGRIARVAEILMIQALAHHARGEDEEALAALERALSLAEPGGYVRAFVDEGEPMAVLLRQAASRGIAPDYVNKLLAAFDFSLASPAKASIPSKIQTLPSEIVEPLSERELEVLQLIAAGLPNQEIAGELTIAVSTVKTHLKNIYGKLAARNRTQAVARARELNLLS